MEVFKQVLALVITPPGNLAYHFIVLFALAVTAALALGGPAGAVRSRLVLTAVLLLIFRITAIIFEFLPTSILDLSVIAPPLDRALGVMTILLIAWIFAFPEPSRFADAVLVTAYLLTMAGLVFSVWLWEQDVRAGRAAYYNGTPQETIWEGVKIAIVLAGMGMLLLRRKDNWAIGEAVLAVLGTGHLIHYQFVETANVAGAERLAEIVALPLLAVLMYRRTHLLLAAAESVQAVLFTPSVSAAPVAAPAEKKAARPAVRRIGIDPKAAVALLSVGTAATPTERAQNAARALAHTFLADICLLIGPPDAGGAGRIMAGYDLVGDKLIPEASVPLGELPQVAAAVLWNQPAALMPGSHEAQLNRLSAAAGVEGIGPTLVVPLASETGTPVGAVVLMASHTQRIWTPGDLNLLTALSRPLTAALAAGGGTLAAAADTAMRLPPKVAETIERLTQELERMTMVAQELEQRQVYAAYTLPDFVEETEETIDQLTQELEQRQAEVDTAEEMARAAQEVMGRLSIDLSDAWAEAARLSKELNEMRLAAEEAQSPLALPLGVKAPPQPGESRLRPSDLQKIASLVQEMNQPIASISGYMDMLLGETTGTLTALQRKFVERTKVACERLSVTLDDLVRAAIIEPAAVDLACESVDIVKVIQEAVQNCEMQYRERKLRLRLDVDTKLPAVQGDRGALLQIFVQLLNNARNASAADSEVTLSVHHEVQRPEAGEPVSYIFISVSDTGGGIPPEDQPRVFSQLSTAGQRIPGLGETGMGLAIAKALVEAHQGRIWIASEMGKGTTFHVLLPSAAKTQAAKGGKQ